METRHAIAGFMQPPMMNAGMQTAMTLIATLMALIRRMSSPSFAVRIMIPWTTNRIPSASSALQLQKHFMILTSAPHVLKRNHGPKASNKPVMIVHKPDVRRFVFTIYSQPFRDIEMDDDVFAQLVLCLS